MLMRKALKSAWFPLVPQLAMLIVLGLLIAGGLGVSTPDAGLAKELRNTNLANLIVWSYWWPLIIIAAIVLGRVWCTVCPIELLSFWAGRYGLRRQVPPFLRSGWGITVFYALILIVGVHTLAIHRLPHRMALYLLTLTGTGVAIAFLYGKRAFCSHVCPVGHLLGLYSMVSPLEWRAGDQSVCKSCKTKDCVAKKSHYRLTARSCTSDL
jgi:polyferredoxin